ncbi:TLC domain-containing protein 5-like [Watersipora subatra]|uniref:TLC domain-containing protein 5-like n=1 Tax=Watersipora subatra TaxID=2589382 RepID=UPI00355C374C
MQLFGPGLSDEGIASKSLSVFVSVTLWSGQYKLLRLWLTHRRPEWCCRIVSLLHGLIATVLCCYSQLVEGPSMHGVEPGLPNNNTQLFIVKICLGYFLFDITWCLYHQTEAPIMLFHHCLSIFGMVCTVFGGKWGTELIGVIALTEISNPLLQLRWFLKTEGYSRTLLGEIVDFLFIAVFGLCRLGLGGYALIGYLSYPNDDILGRFGAVAIFIVSIIFYYYILGYAYKKYSRMYFGSHKCNGAFHSSDKPQINGGSQVKSSVLASKSQQNGHLKVS